MSFNANGSKGDAKRSRRPGLVMALLVLAVLMVGGLFVAGRVLWRTIDDSLVEELRIPAEEESDGVAEDGDAVSDDSADSADDEIMDGDDGASGRGGNKSDIIESDEPKTAEEIACENWSGNIAKLVEMQDNDKRPTESDVRRFKALFDKIPDESKEEQVHEALNLLNDGCIDCLASILFDLNEPKDVLEAVYHDIMNRPEEVKMPLVRRVARDERHPMSEDALDVLIAVDDSEGK